MPTMTTPAADPSRPSAPVPAGLDQPGPGDQPITRRGTILESAAVFLIGLALAASIHGGAEGETGLAGNDSFYHLRMATLLPEVGLIDTFPWLRYAYFTDTGDRFVSHHYGFHLMLLPFARLSEAWTGDALAGGRWAIAFFSGVNLVLVNLLLLRLRVPCRWLWLLVYALLPYHYFTRQSHVRAIAPSLMFLQLLLLCLLTGRRRWAALVIGLYVHLYLGAVMYAPLVVAAWASSQIDAPPAERRGALRTVLWTVGGWALGALTYPYAGGMIDFLRLQVFGTGLSPDIEVGNEWLPYSDPWWFVMGLCGPLFAALSLSLLVRLRLGRRIDRETTTLLLLNVGFLVLTLKARRFIEYWPVFCLLSSATLAAPWLRQALSRGWGGVVEIARERSGQLWLLGVGPAAAGILIGAVIIPRMPDAKALLQHWHWVFAAAAAYAGVLIARVPSAVRRAGLPRGALAPLTVSLVSVAALGVLSTTVVAGPAWRAARSEAKCAYDLGAIREMMRFLKAESQPGDLIFTDDWDVFPVFFYYNTHNHYIVGLDPKFTHERRPDLWERFVRITRGEVPTQSVVRPPGSERDETVSVRLSDIRDVFEAKYVITDRDHRRMADLLAAAPDLAELVYPASSYESARTAPYLVFRVISDLPPVPAAAGLAPPLTSH